MSSIGPVFLPRGIRGNAVQSDHEFTGAHGRPRHTARPYQHRGDQAAEGRRDRGRGLCGHGDRARARVPEDAHRARAAGGGRRSSGRDVDRNSAPLHVDRRVDHRRRRRDGGRRHVGREQRRRRLQPGLHRPEGFAGPHSGRIHLDSRRDYRRTDHRRGRAPRRDLLERCDRRFHRDVVRPTFLRWPFSFSVRKGCLAKS